MSNTQEMIELMEKKLKYLNQSDAKMIIDYMTDYMSDQLHQGNNIEIRGFGSMSIRSRKYRHQDQHYNTVCYRMSQKIRTRLKLLEKE